MQLRHVDKSVLLFTWLGGLEAFYTLNTYIVCAAFRSTRKMHSKSICKNDIYVSIEYE